MKMFPATCGSAAQHTGRVLNTNAQAIWDFNSENRNDLP